MDDLTNGLLRQLWWLGDAWPSLLCAATAVWQTLRAPRRHRAWIAVFAAATVPAAALGAAPIPYIMAGLCILVVVAVWKDRLNPETLQFRATGGLLGYAVAIMGSEVGYWMLDHQEPAAYARAIAGYGDSAEMLGSARSIMRTLITWGLWLIVPSGIAGMIFQGFASHRPLEQPADDLLRDITHGHGQLPGLQPPAPRPPAAPAGPPPPKPDLV